MEEELSPQERRLVRTVAARVAEVGAVAVPAALLWALVETSWAPLARLDEKVTRDLTVKATSRQLPMWEMFSDVLHPNMQRIGVLTTGVVLWKQGRRREALWAGVTMAGGGLLGHGLKSVVARTRPLHENPVASARGWSFPSLHASNSVLGSGILYLLAREHLTPTQEKLALGAAGTVVVVTSYDRLALGVHHLSDVLAGWSFGYAVLKATEPLLTAAQRRRA